MTRKRLGTGDIRDVERSDVRRFNDNSVSLPNPSANPPLDKHSPISSDEKALALGFEPTQPKRLFDLPKGDAGTGQTAYRKIHAFFNLAQPGDLTRVGASNFVKALPIITMRSESQNSKYWHVSIYGIGVRRPDDGALLSPLSISEIHSRQFEQYFAEFPPGTFVPLSPRFVPSVNTSQIRVMIHDESGQRFFDADVIGTRSFSLYGWGVTVFLLVKDEGYEVDARNEDANRTFTGNGAGVEDDLIGGRVVGIFSNRTENIQNRTLSITIDPSAFGASSAPRIVPIPPGARTVQIYSTNPAPSQDWLLQFWYGRATSVGRPDVGIIDWRSAADSRTRIVKIPNAPSIAITPINPRATPITSFSLVFEVEP